MAIPLDGQPLRMQSKRKHVKINIKIFFFFYSLDNSIHIKAIIIKHFRITVEIKTGNIGMNRRKRRQLTCHSHMPVGLPFVYNLHHFLWTRHKAFCAPLWDRDGISLGESRQHQRHQVNCGDSRNS